MEQNEFQKMIRNFIDLDPSNLRRLADAILVSIPTVGRWAEGKNMPHKIMMPPIIKFIQSQTKNK